MPAPYAPASRSCETSAGRDSRSLTKIKRRISGVRGRPLDAPERHDLVLHIMTDIGRPEERHAHLAAPAFDDLLDGFGEGRIIGDHVIDAAETYPGNALQLSGMRHLEEHPVYPVERLRDFLDHQDMAGEIGEIGRADQRVQDGEVERHGGLLAETGLER